MFWLLFPAGYAAVRLAKAAVNAPTDAKPEAVGKEVISLTIDAAKVARCAALMAVGATLAAYDAVTKPNDKYRSNDDSHHASSSGLSVGERFIETSGGLEGWGSGFDSGGI
jgi:hypothetical protein